jgi:hypothetical protein
MAHFAELNESNIVLRVIVINDNDCDGGVFPYSEQPGINFCKLLFGDNTIWKQTSYNGNFRYNFAGFEYIYDDENDAFISPKPYNSWVLNDKFIWVAPVDYPDNLELYQWDEDSISWVIMES